MLGQRVFPQTLTDYLSTLKKHLNDERTAIFLDTNILAFPYRLFPSARDELFNWLQTLGSAGRLRVPAWAASEYFSRVQSSRLQEFAPAFSEHEQLTNPLKNQVALARLAVDDQWLSKLNPPKSREVYLQELEQAVAGLQDLLRPLTSGVKSKPDDIHDRLQAVVGPSILPSDVAKLCDEAARVGPTRFEHRLPPGFEDRPKGENKLGDLILWLEILDHSATEASKFDRVLLVTNDQKKDWSYRPNLRRASNPSGVEQNDAPKLRIADPRLVREFKRRVRQDAEFEVASIELVIAAYSHGGSGEFRQLAAALQLLQEAKQGSRAGKSPSKVSPKAAVPSPSSEVPPAAIEPSPVQSPKSGPTAPVQEHGLSLTETALQDKFYVPNPATKIGDLIARLRSRTWYTQNPAIDEIRLLSGKSFSPDDWFVLGRAIYASACGNAFEAMSYLGRLEHHLGQQEPAAANTLLAGMLYEVYFASNGSLRSSFKAQFLGELFGVVGKDPYSLAKNFIQTELAKNEAKLIILPGDGKEFIARVSGTRAEKDLATAPVTTRVIWIIDQITLNERELLKTVEDSELPPVRADDLQRLLSRRYAIPTSRLRLEFDPPEMAEQRLSWDATTDLKDLHQLVQEGVP